jgi:uncharacterized membrane protein
MSAQPVEKELCGKKESIKEIYWLFLTHHFRAEADRCIRLRLTPWHKVALCSRCSGLYPMLALSLAIQLLFGWQQPVVRWLDSLIISGASLPAVIDWGLSRLDHRGSNFVRLLTGALLGIGLSRGMLLYFQEPKNELFWAYALLLLACVIAFELVRKLDIEGRRDHFDD